MRCFECRSFKGCWGFEEMEHGNLTSNQVILYQEIQFPGMDVVFFPYTLPVYPHPASQRFPFLINSPLPRQRPPCPFWRSASLKSLSQPSVTDVPGHPTSTPMVHTYTRPLVIGEVKGSLIFELHHVHRGTKKLFVASGMKKLASSRSEEAWLYHLSFSCSPNVCISYASMLFD